MYPPERASDTYKKGFRHGVAGLVFSNGGYDSGTFGNRDFLDGVAAGANEVFWSVVRQGLASEIQTRLSGEWFCLTRCFDCKQVYASTRTHQCLLG